MDKEGKRNLAGGACCQDMAAVLPRQAQGKACNSECRAWGGEQTGEPGDGNQGPHWLPGVRNQSSHWLPQGMLEPVELTGT